MGRARTSVPRSRAAWHRRLLMDPAAIRYWLLVAAVACTVAAIVGHAVDEAQVAQRAWGQTRRVVVTTRAVGEGGALDAATHVERWPVRLVPHAALRSLPAHARSAAALDAGTVISSAAIEPAQPGAGGRRTVAVPLDGAHLPVEPGDRVDVWATRDPTVVADGDPATQQVVTGARVVAVDEDRAVLAVRALQVPGLAEAAATATITLVGSG